jgi:hypothetical protein
MEGWRVRQGRLPRQEKEMIELPRQEFVGWQQDVLAV